MSATAQVFRRELASLLLAPLMVVFLVAFLVLAGALAFFVGGFYMRGQADLQAFFEFQPWLFLLLAPALSMRLWAQERRSGSIELLLSLPLRTSQAVLGKFFAAWVYAGFALVLTMPLWIMVNYLGEPDNGVIVAGYIGSWFLAGMYIAFGSAISAMTRSPTLAFVLAAALCLALALASYPPLHDALQATFGTRVADAVAALGVGDRFAAIARGVLMWRDVAYFGAGVGTGLLASWLGVQQARVD